MNQPMTHINVSEEPTSTRLIASMAVAGFLSGIIIIAIYIATFDTIKANKATELRTAVFKVLPGTTDILSLKLQNKSLQVWSGDPDDETIFAGYDDQQTFIGFAISSAGPGFQDTIRVLYGYRPDLQRIVGMEILESRETPGLGDKIYKDAEFVANFDQLAIKPTIITVKKGTKSAINEVDAITGATISAKAVVRIINEGNQRWIDQLPSTFMKPLLPEAETIQERNSDQNGSAQ